MVQRTDAFISVSDSTKRLEYIVKRTLGIIIDQVPNPIRCLLCSQRLVGVKERRGRANVRHEESVKKGTGLGEVRCPAGPNTYNSLQATMQRRASRADNCVCASRLATADIWSSFRASLGGGSRT